MYAIHLPWSSLFCEQAVRRLGEKGLISGDMQGPGSYEAGSGKRERLLAPVTARMGRKRHVRRSRQLFLKRSFLGMQVNGACLASAARRGRSFLGMQVNELQLSRNAWAKPGRSEAGQHTSAQSVRARGISKATPSGWQTSRHAGQSLRHPRVRSFRPSLQKNRLGRLCGAWLPRKKTL